MRASTCDTVSRLCVRPECCWFAFPLVPALGSTGSAADRSALFASFAATTAGSDFPRSFIIGYRFSLPDADQKRNCSGRTRDLPSSDAILLRVICSSTPAGRAWPRLAALSMLRSTLCTVSAPATYPLRGSITHPTQPLCTLRGRRRRRLTQHSLPGCLLGITWVGLSPTDRANFAWRLRRVGPGADIRSIVIRTKVMPLYGGGRPASHQAFVNASRLNSHSSDRAKHRPLPPRLQFRAPELAAKSP